MQDLVTLPGYSPFEQPQPDQLALHAFPTHALEGLPAGKRRFPQLDRPSQAGFDRIDRLVDLVTVKRESGFQAKGISCPQAARLQAGRDAGFQQEVPQRGRMLRRIPDFESVLARVSGPKHSGFNAPHAGFNESLKPQLVQPGLRERVEYCHAAGSLQRDEHALFAQIPDFHVVCGGGPAKPVQVLLPVARVGNDQQAVRRPVDQEIIDNAAVGPARQGIVGPVWLEPFDVVYRDVVHEGHGVRSGNLDAAHVGDIEQAGFRADRVMFGKDAFVLHRHLPAAERHQPSAQVQVAFIECGSTQSRHEMLPTWMHSASPLAFNAWGSCGVNTKTRFAMGFRLIGTGGCQRSTNSHHLLTKG